MAGKIYVHRDGKNHGPMTVEEAVERARKGQLSTDDYVWTGEGNTWVRAGEVPILADAFRNVPVPAKSHYFVRVNEKTVGPMTMDEIIILIHKSQVRGDTFIWLPDQKRWQRGRNIPELAEYFVEIPAPPDFAETPPAEEERVVRVKSEAERKSAADFERDKSMARTVDDDRNFLKTLVFVSLLYILVILSVNFVYVPKTAEDTSLEIFHRVTKLVVDKPIAIEAVPEPVVTDVPSGIGTSGGSGGGSGGSGGEPGGDDFASKGVVGLITRLGGTGTVVDMMGTGGDLDLAVAGLGGLKTDGTPTVGTGGGLGSGLGPGGGLGGGGEGLGALAEKDKTKMGMTKLKGARMSTSPPAIRGSAVEHSKRSSAVIASIVNRHKTGIEYIYKKYLKTNPGMEGKIIVRFTIAASGAVTYSAVVASTIGNPAFESEVASRVMTWRFPEIDAGEVTVEYPFVFFSAGA